MITGSIFATLAAVGVIYGTFRAGCRYEARRLSALIDWAMSLAADLDASMTLLEASSQTGAVQTDETEEMRMH